MERRDAEYAGAVSGSATDALYRLAELFCQRDGYRIALCEGGGEAVLDLAGWTSGRHYAGRCLVGQQMEWCA